MKKLLIAALLACSTVATAAQTPLRFATEATYPPFEFVGADNKLQGFDIDLANALCAKLNTECAFSNQAFDSLIPGLRFKRFDAVISGMDITPERARQVLFTTPYYQNSAQFITRRGQYSDLNALKGKRIGVQNGTTHQKYLMNKHPEVTLVPYDSYQNAILDLQNQRIDAVFGDSAVVENWLKQHNDLVTVGDKVTDADYFGQGLGIAVRHNNRELQQALNNALDALRQGGTLQKIYQTWFH